MIEEYHFGSITIDGKIYTEDVEVKWDNEVLLWQRKESHTIDIEAIKRAVEQGPEVIVIGTGETGMAKVIKEARNFIEEKGIKLIIDKTEEAVKTFNVICEESLEEDGRQVKVVGLFHLTC
jgi:hypothetical protein